MRHFVRASLALLAFAAQGQAQEIQGGYVGLSLGSFDYSSDDVFGAPISDNASAYRVLGGYQFNSYYAIEAAWSTNEGIKETFSAVDPFFGNVSLTFNVDYEIATLRVLAMAPMDNMSFFGGAGYFDAKISRAGRYEDAFEVATVADEVTDSGAMVVGGILFELKRIALRGEYEWYDADDVDATTISFSALFRF